MDFCYSYSEVFESYVPGEKIDSYDLEFRNSMEKIYSKILYESYPVNIKIQPNFRAEYINLKKPGKFILLMLEPIPGERLLSKLELV